MHQNNDAPSRSRKEAKTAPPSQAEVEMMDRINYAIAHPRCTKCFRSRCNCGESSSPARSQK